MLSGPVVITGLGTLSSAGVGREALAAALAAGLPRTLPIDHPPGYVRRGGVTVAARCAGLDLGRWLDAGRARRMSAPSRFAVAAARMALEDAGLPLRPGRGVRSVAIATAFGAGVFTESLLTEIVTGGPRTASPFLFTDCVANAPAGQIAIDVQATGANATIVQREAGPLLALIEGAASVASGRSDACLVGHVDEVGPLAHAVLDRMGALCPPDADGRVRPRPFGARRRGFVFGEGATVVVLEQEPAVAERGGRALARVVAAARAFDATAPRADWGTGAQALASRLRAALDRAGVPVATIGGIVSGASGSVRGDRLEALVLRRLFGDRLPPIVVPKAVTGEYGGGNLGAALLVLAGAPCASPTPASDLDPDLALGLHEGPLPQDVRRVLVSGLASGGAAAWVVLERQTS